MFRKRPLVVIFAFAAFTLILFSNLNLRSNKVQPPAFYCNDPNPFVGVQNCSFCHNGVPSYDSTNFILQMGTDSSSMSNVLSGVTTYTPGTQYFMRVKGTTPSPVYGFELTADDTSNTGTDVTNFAILNPTNTSLLSVSYNFVAHHNATNNNEWTFMWTAPTNYQGLVTFYYAGNDGVAGDTTGGDHIFLASKSISSSGANGISSPVDKVNLLRVFPTIFENQIQISFGLNVNSKVQGTIVDLNGRVIRNILDEGLMAGSFNRNFDLSGLQAGVYLVKIQVGEAFTVSKIVKV